MKKFIYSICRRKSKNNRPNSLTVSSTVSHFLPRRIFLLWKMKRNRMSLSSISSMVLATVWAGALFSEKECHDAASCVYNHRKSWLKQLPAKRSLLQYKRIVTRKLKKIKYRTTHTRWPMIFTKETNHS